MENKLNKEELEGILNMLKMKQQFLVSCAKDYEVQIAQVERMLKESEPSVTVKEKSEESKN